MFGDRLSEHFDWVTSFNVEPERHNDYYLLFGTGHKDGLREMKRGMWAVDKPRRRRLQAGQDPSRPDAAVRRRRGHRSA